MLNALIGSVPILAPDRCIFDLIMGIENTFPIVKNIPNNDQKIRVLVIQFRKSDSSISIYLHQKHSYINEDLNENLQLFLYDENKLV